MMLALLFLMLAIQMSPEALRERALYGRLARLRAIEFARLSMPLPSDPYNCRLSRYKIAEHHRFIATQLDRFARGEIRRLMISLPYRHGKTELAVRRFVPFLLGNHPSKSVIVVTHTDSLACEHGRDIRSIMRGPAYRLAFGRGLAELAEDSQAQDRLQTVGGGVAMFTGRGGLGGGFGEDWIIFDDFFKNSEEARSRATRDHAWETYISDCKSRLNESTGGILMIGTRKHVDDVQGRILDPRNEHYDPREAATWTVIRIPALSEGPDVDPLQRQKDTALWPERFPFEFWDQQRTSPSELVRMDFETQGQCNPTPEQGKFFKADWLKTYTADQLPKTLRYYCASDHAVTEDQRNDATVIMPFGVCPQKQVWVLPDLAWVRYESVEIVETMLAIMRKYRPLQWAAEREHISKSILPFLRLRQLDERVFGYIEESPAVRHPEVRAWSIRGMLALGRVHFPSFAPWWNDARHELLEFPNGAHDDFVSALSHAGTLLDKVLAAEPSRAEHASQPYTGEWLKRTQERARQKEAEKKGVGW